MVKEIELLLPLLSQATNGAIWLIAALIAKDVLLWGGLIVGLVMTARKIAWYVWNDNRQAMSDLQRGFEFVRSAYLYDEDNKRTPGLRKIMDELEEMTKKP